MLPIKKTVLEILKDSTVARKNDRALVWEFWRREGLVEGLPGDDFISRWQFWEASDPSSIIRARQKIQQEFPELR